MSVPKKPVGGTTSQAGTLAAVGIFLSELTPTETRWVTAYRTMDDEARGDHLMFAESSALVHPRRGAAASSGAHGIHLVAAFGKVVAK